MYVSMAYTNNIHIYCHLVIVPKIHVLLADMFEPPTCKPAWSSLALKCATSGKLLPFLHNIWLILAMIAHHFLRSLTF